MTMQRREFLGLGALAASGALLDARVAFAHPDSGRSRLVLVIMRGALDGLAAVPALGDRDYPELRREFALRAPGEVGGALPLDGFFGLHPALAFMQQCYAARELIVLHALASPYRERSHFDGQDVLENGSPRPHALQTGWLNRALYQGRDLAPTLDLRSALKCILSEHLAVPARALEQEVFPDSAAAKPLRGLMRT